MITLNKTGRLLSVLLMAAALFVPSAFGAALTTTTLTNAVPAPNGNQQTVTNIVVGSSTGMVAQPSQPNAQGGLGGPSATNVATYLFVDHELMQINAINGTTISVGRGVQGTVATAHNAGAIIYIASGRQMWNSIGASPTGPSGACNSAFQPVSTPYIDPNTGLYYDCPSTGPFLNTWVVAGNIPAYTVSTTNLNPNTIQFSSNTFTAAQINTMFTTPLTLIAAQGAGTLIEIQSCVVDLKRGSAAFTSGGTATIGYGTTQSLNAASPAAATIASTVFTTFAASQSISVAGALAITANTLDLNTPVTISNATQVFATGTGATVVVDCAYRVHNGL